MTAATAGAATELLISETFASIQGEGLRAGTPTAFLRLARCPLRCVWCDSAYTFYGGERLTLEGAIARIAAFGPLPNVCITGGEPLVQRRAVQALIPRLFAELPALRSVEIETSGFLALWQAEPRLHWNLDVKCPLSGMESHNRWENLALLREGDEVKFVIAGREDFDYALRVVRERLAMLPVVSFFNPAWGLVEPKELVAWLLAANPPHTRLGLQQHKYIWGPDVIGV
ncbi:MAG TPA: radical SAM protein [Dehalococcoidia bacterium]